MCVQCVHVIIKAFSSTLFKAMAVHKKKKSRLVEPGSKSVWYTMQIYKYHSIIQMGWALAHNLHLLTNNRQFKNSTQSNSFRRK